MKRVVRIKSICQMTGCSPATIWRWVKTDPAFPKPFKLGPNSTGWDDSEIDRWLSARKAGASIASNAGACS